MAVLEAGDELPNSLTSFLDMQFSSEKKRKKSVLGVLDPSLGKMIFDHYEGSIKISTDDIVKEIVRGIRLHFHHLLDEISESDIIQSQLSLRFLDFLFFCDGLCLRCKTLCVLMIFPRFYHICL